MQADRRQLTAFALLGLVMVLWAGNSIVGRAVRFDVPPLTLAFVRWLGASLILLPFAIAPLRCDWSAIKKAWKPMLVQRGCEISALLLGVVIGIEVVERGHLEALAQ